MSRPPLPAPDRLRTTARAVALLDELLAADRSERVFAYDPVWARGEAVASFRSGEGDTLFAWFAPGGVVVRGFDPEAGAGDPAALFAGLPPSLARARREPAFGEASFAFWWPTGATAWGSAAARAQPGAALRALFDGAPRTYVRFARDYHEVRLAVADVARVYAGGPITPELIRALAPRAEETRIMKRARTLGFATAAAQAPAKKPRKAPARRPPDDEDDDLIGEAEFKVIAIGDAVKMVVGGKVAAAATGEELYDQLFAHVKSVLAKKKR